MQDDTLMDTEEVAKYLKVHPKTVTSLVARKLIKASKVGRDWRFRKKDVDEYLERKSNFPSDSQEDET